MKLMEILNSNKLSLSVKIHSNRASKYLSKVSQLRQILSAPLKKIRSDFILTKDQNKIVNDGSLKRLRRLKMGDKIKLHSKFFLNVENVSKNLQKI